ncbi:sensor histidine kinase [Sporosarcina highlanderae]|uniref:Sensor histidine kinase n=1 Tax=Sporosarcina highlanderae TaxID=3035916 RepID=A0ABT8JLW1_9BACL|nr:sensor histidine kinase [Sporosarcina highlanderae]MDN4606130.1 sensor histidine kinase [Sporosarcina highlanderae]
MNQFSNENLPSLLMNLYGNSGEAIFFFDRNGKVLTMNSAAKDILDKDVYEQMMAGSTGAICRTCRGYTSSDELQTCHSCYMSNPDENISSFQVYFDTKGKGVIPYSGSIHTIDEESGIRVFMLRDLTQQFKTQEELNQKLMMKRVIKAQEDERKRLSRELHDSVAQEMLSSLVDLRVLKYMNIDEEVLKKVQQTEGSLMRLLDDIRHLSVELRPATLDDLGLEAAFRTHFKWIEKNYGLIIHFHPELESKRYEGEVETVVYRICQEAVFNALKYAEVDELVVRLYEAVGFLYLVVVDEGKGFELKNTDPKGTGLGIYSMKERAELVDGNLQIRSEIGKGTVIQLEVPVVEGGGNK